jgi:hypothetical protein
MPVVGGRAGRADHDFNDIQAIFFEPDAHFTERLGLQFLAS